MTCYQFLELLIGCFVSYDSCDSSNLPPTRKIPSGAIVGLYQRNGEPRCTELFLDRAVISLRKDSGCTRLTMTSSTCLNSSLVRNPLPLDLVWRNNDNNRNQYAVLLSILMHEENLDVNQAPNGGSTVPAWTVAMRRFSGTSVHGRSFWCGHFVFSSFNQLGPTHHRVFSWITFGWIPREIRSAGLQIPGTCP